MENKKINYVIVDRRNNYEIEQKEDFKNLNTYDKYYEKAKEEIGKKLRIEKINTYLLENIDKKDIKKVLLNIEEIIQKYRL